MASAGDLTALNRAYALVCPNICQDAVGRQGPPGPQGPQGEPGPATDLTTNPVGSYYSDQTQNISTASTTVWTLNHSTFQRSIAIVSNSRITVYVAGVYEVYYSAQINRTQNGSNDYIYIWIRINGVDVPETNGRININSNNGDNLPIVPYIVELNAGDYVEFVAQATDTHFQILAVNPSPIGPAIPSLIVGIKRIG